MLGLILTSGVVVNDLAWLWTLYKLRREARDALNRVDQWYRRHLRGTKGG